MAEEEIGGISPKLATGMSSDDITPRIYEGGFKTWECCIDLARYLEQLIVEGDLDLKGREVQIVEVRVFAGVQAHLWLLGVQKAVLTADSSALAQPFPPLYYSNVFSLHRYHKVYLHVSGSH